MDNNGKPRSQNQNEDLEQRIYQVLVLLERAGEQQRTAADTLARAGAWEKRIDQAIESATISAAGCIAESTRSALEGAIADSAESLRQAARGAVAAAENLRQPWWLHLMVILVAGVLSASLAFWATHTSDIAAYQQTQREQQLIREGQMLERVWPKLTPTQRKKFEQLNAER